MLHAEKVNPHDRAFHNARQHRGDGRARNTHGGQPQVTEDQNIIEGNVADQRQQRGVQRHPHNLHALEHAHHRGGERIGQVAEGHNGQVLHGQVDHLRFARVDHQAKQGTGEEPHGDDAQHGKQQAGRRSHRADGFDALHIALAPILGDQHHRARGQAIEPSRHKGGDGVALRHGG